MSTIRRILLNIARNQGRSLRSTLRHRGGRAVDEAYHRVLLDRQHVHATLVWSQISPVFDEFARTGSAEAQAKLGGLLAGFLSQLGWARDANEILAAHQQGTPVELVLQFNDRELFALPWSIVPLKPTGGATLGELTNLCYHRPGAAIRPAARGRILVVGSAAGGAVPWKEHFSLIERAAGTSRSVDGIFGITAERLKTELASGDVEILHVLCHGRTVDGAGSPGLLLGETGGAAQVIDADQLRRIVAAPDLLPPGLVVLSACNGARAGGLDTWLSSGVHELHAAGVPEVVGSRFVLSMTGSIEFVKQFYGALFDAAQPGDAASVQQAVSAARKALLQRMAVGRDGYGLQHYSTTAGQRAGGAISEPQGSEELSRSAGCRDLRERLLEAPLKPMELVAAYWPLLHFMRADELAIGDFLGGRGRAEVLTEVLEDLGGRQSTSGLWLEAAFAARIVGLLRSGSSTRHMVAEWLVGFRSRQPEQVGLLDDLTEEIARFRPTRSVLVIWMQRSLGASDFLLKAWWQ